jgi:uncharacterized cupin superfamily protein
VAVAGPVINRDDVRTRAVAFGELAFERRRLGHAAGAVRIGCSLYEVPPRARQMPVHVHGDEEEIFFVLEGSGMSWHRGQTCLVEPGDAIVHRPHAGEHTFFAGDGGLQLLAFASGTDTGITWLPRAQVMWCGPHWVPVDAPHPFEAEAVAGELERPQPGPRPANVVAPEQATRFPSDRVEARLLGQAAGSRQSGLNYVKLPPEGTGAPPHCHALEEELFVVLDGSGTLTLDGEEHPLRPGDVIARPPATGVSHSLQAGGEGMTYLAYGTSVPGDSVYYPLQGTVWLRGLGVRIDVPGLPA